MAITQFESFAAAVSN